MKQQELLRGAMASNNLSRNAFCKIHGIARRAIDAWLLPSDSNGFRCAPAEFLSLVENSVLMSGVGCYKDVSSKGDQENSLRVACKTGSGRIVFPLLYSAKDGGNAFPHLHSDFIEGENGSVATSTPELVDGEAFWTYVVHHRSIDSMRGYVGAAKNIAEVSQGEKAHVQIECAKIDGEYFTLMTVKAPDFCNEPLFIFKADFLVLNDDDAIQVKSWVRCVKADGSEIKKIPSLQAKG